MAQYELKGTILKVENLSYSIGENLILRDINLEIKDIIRKNHTTGQIISCLGKSGVGKTTLFNLLSGLSTPTTGKILVGDGPTQKHIAVGDVGVVAQNYPLFDFLTVWKNLDLVALDKEKKDKIGFYLDKFGMIDHKEKYPAQLSGGQRQRIAIIQQLLSSENFILMDEPFSGLDPIAKDNVCNMIQQVADIDENNTIIVVTHDITSAVAISEYIWVMGFDYDTETKQRIPGARIKYVENLMDKGLAWKENLTETPEFFSFVKGLRNAFDTL